MQLIPLKIAVSFFFKKREKDTKRVTRSSGKIHQPNFLSYDMNRIERDVSNNSSTFVYIRSCGNVFTEPLPSDDKWHIHRHEDCREGFMKYATEIGSDVMIYISILITFVQELKS
jgi:hypothetical protein